MIEKIFYFGVFLICIGMVINLATRGVFLGWAHRAWHGLREMPAARRRRAYLENELRLTRERQHQYQYRSRSTSDH